MSIEEVKNRLYTKRNGRYYIDFRGLGGSRQAVIPDGARTATTDHDEALVTGHQMLRDLLSPGSLPDDTPKPEAERPRETTKDDSPLRWDRFVVRHFDTLSRANRTKSSIKRINQSLRFFLLYWMETHGDSNPRIDQITTNDLDLYEAWRARRFKQENGRKISPRTVHNDRFALSGLFAYAKRLGLIPRNPAEGLTKIKIEAEEAQFLEVDEAARLMEAAGRLDEDPAPRAFPWFQALVATLLLTGFRISELARLRISQVDFENGRIHFPNRKNPSAGEIKRAMPIPIWPQLREILEPHIEARIAEGDSDLVFPSPSSGGPIKDIRGSLQRACKLAGIEKNVTAHTLRHTYAATRVQTLDNGEPVSPFVVAAEMGHQSTKMIETHYRHLAERRNRLPVVEYRLPPSSAGDTGDTSD